MYVMYNLLPYLIRRSTAPHLLPPLEDDYSPDLDPNHNIEEVSPSEGGTSVYSMLRPVCFGPAFILCRSGFLTIQYCTWIQIMKMKPTKLPVVH